MVLKDKKIVLVVCGGIAAYKSAELARSLVRSGAQVRVAMTSAAKRFVTPLTFQTLTGQPVADDLWAEDRPREVAHISLADWGEAVLIAPATANLIGKMAVGLADDFVTTFLLAVRAPIVICPSMNVNMYEHDMVQANLARLREHYRVVEPASGELACGWEGRGRLPDVPIIVEELCCALTLSDMKGLGVLITAGPTREAWDSIRYLSNSSSGRMGVALARVARRRGAKVILIAGPINMDPPHGLETISVESTRDMREAVQANLERVDVLIKAAAPADFRPVQVTAGKIKKEEIPSPIELCRNPDILAEIGNSDCRQILVGFAAESHNLLKNSLAKLKAKNLDLIVANQIGVPDEAFGAETNRVWIIDHRGRTEEIPLMSKEEVASRILDRVVNLIQLRSTK